MTEQKTLVKKLTEVMKEVKYIEKKGFNKFHGYKYATESDVAEKVREVLAERNVMMIPNLINHEMREHINAKGKTEYITSVDMEFTFYDGDSGENLVFRMSGEGQDAGDKGIYKAITGAQKYALMKVFMIPTGDDPEADSSVDERNDQKGTPQNQQNAVEPISGPQVGMLKSIVKELAIHGKVEDQVIYDSLARRINIKFADVTELNKQQASRAIAQLNTWKKEKLGA